MNPDERLLAKNGPDGQGSSRAVVARKWTLRGSSAEILVSGARVTVYLSNWSGLETYSVDGKEALRVRSFAFSGTREIPLPDGRTLRFEVRNFPVINARLVLDGNVVVENLFPHLRAISRTAIGMAGGGAVLFGIAELVLYLLNHQFLPGR